MCGIAGILGRSSVSSTIVPQIWSIHNTRGPDDRGYLALRDGVIQVYRDWKPSDADAEALFIHNRLSIIDTTDGGWQPMSSTDGKVHIITNGEIYNFVELKEELVRLGHQFNSTSDTEVLLAAYRQWNRACLTRLVGMFAMAVLDLERRVVFLARDFFGIKPLFYARSHVGFVFGSTIRSALQASRIESKAHPETIPRFLRWGVSDFGDQTMLLGIKQLPAAHYMEVALDDVDQGAPVRYWSIDEAQELDLSFEEAAGALKTYFLRNVDIHMRSDVPVGVSLSGGLDSSSIIMAMRELKGNSMNVHAFSFVADDPDISEERWIDLVGGTSGACIHKTRSSESELAADLEDLIETQGEPFGSCSVYAQRRVFRMAHEAGIKVVLDGQGADEMLGGYVNYLGARLGSLVRQRRYQAIVKFLRSASKRWDIRRRSILEYSGRFLIPPYMEGMARVLLGRDVQPWMNKDWGNVPGGNFSHCPSSRILTSELAWSMNNPLLALLRYEDRNSMAFSVESRVPFLTPDLVQFVLSLPEHYIISDDGESKTILRAAMRGIVPDAVLDRRDKIGFEPPERAWLMEIRPWIDRTLASESAAAVAALNLPQLRRHTLEMLSGRRAFSHELWRALNLIEWTRLYNVSYFI